MRPEDIFDFRNPDYVPIFRARLDRLQKIRQNPACLPALKQYYRTNIAEFICDWGCTFDPRNPERRLPSYIPFLLFDKQKEWVNWTIENWLTQTPGITEKTRDMGMSWLAIALACSLCLFEPGMSIGFGSRKEEYVDKIGHPKSLIEKARMFLGSLPPEFRGGWERNKHAPHMRLIFPQTNSIISGESGDGIGRGDRQSIYFIDESAFLERPQLIEASLSATTNCRQDISTPNGMGNPFAVKRFSGNFKVFTFHWRDDPRKNDEWYGQQLIKLDEVTVAQEIDINYSASTQGIIIPSKWVQAAINAHVKLGITPTGIRKAALDVADEGRDLNALCGRYGILVDYLDAWSGQNGDIFATTLKAINLCDERDYTTLYYDSDGLGAGVRGDSRVINEQRGIKRNITTTAFRGSAAVVHPSQEMVPGRKNKDFFGNMKAQAWWSLRLRFQATFRAVIEGMEINPDDIISISPDLPMLTKLTGELSQSTYKTNVAGKILIDKTPEGSKSPNLADALMINFAPQPPRLAIMGNNQTFWDKIA